MLSDDECNCPQCEAGHECLDCYGHQEPIDPPPPIPGGPYLYCPKCSEDGPSERQIERMMDAPDEAERRAEMTRVYFDLK
jgi:hypothetical protein